MVANLEFIPWEGSAGPYQFGMLLKARVWGHVKLARDVDANNDDE